MSLLTVIFLWVSGSCVATPLIGAFLGKHGRSQEYRGHVGFDESRSRCSMSRNGDTMFAGGPLVARFPRRRPAAADFALRTSHRLRR